MATTPEGIRKNAQILNAALDKVNLEVLSLQAMMRANQAMCRHPNKKYKYDYWSCDDCGASP